MPIYDYLCNTCGTHYDVFHKVREQREDISCPTCHSNDFCKLMSIPAAVGSMISQGNENCRSQMSGGECCGGMCRTH